MATPQFHHRYRFAEVPAEIPEPVLTLEQMSWEQRFVAAWAALCEMECRAESAERRVVELGGLIPVAVNRPVQRPRKL
jgi:hypothetical protein